METKPRILFLCTGNSCRSQMAEGWARHLALAFLLGGGAAAQPAASSDPPVVSIERIRSHIATLGHDDMAGRGTGTVGGLRAADYLEAELSRLPLEPLGDDGTFRQQVPMHASEPLAESRLRVVDSDGAAFRSLELWRDYVLFDGGAETFIAQPLPMVFVGYGIVAPEYDHNDYQRVDPSGQVVVFLAGEPPSSDASYFDGMRATVYSDPAMKFRTALSRGASGALLLPSPREGRYVDWQRVLDLFRTENVELPYGLAGSLNALVHPAQAEALFRHATVSWEEVLALDRTGELSTFPLPSRLSFAGVFRERDFLSPNLVARLAGADPLLRDEVVIVSAHYDALGIGRPRRRPDRKGSSLRRDDIYNGVIDNASGTAVVLELARVLAAGEARPLRSVLFVLVTGEEKGLLGSRYYRDHPVVPLHRTVAAINVDGISFLDTTDEFVGVGAELSTLGDVLAQSLAASGLRRGEVPDLFDAREPFHTSDQLAFAQAGIPSILVMEGLAFRHLSAEEGLDRFVSWGRERYHTPFDDLEQPIDPAAVQQHAEVLLAFVRAVADTPQEPRWLPGTPWIGERLRSLAEGR